MEKPSAPPLLEDDSDSVRAREVRGLDDAGSHTEEEALARAERLRRENEVLRKTLAMFQQRYVHRTFDKEEVMRHMSYRDALVAGKQQPRHSSVASAAAAAATATADVAVPEGVAAERQEQEQEDDEDDEHQLEGVVEGAQEQQSDRTSSVSSSTSVSHLVSESLETTTGTQSLYGRLQEHVQSEAFLATLQRNRALLVANKDDKNQVALVDFDDEEWWTLVPKAEDVRREQLGLVDKNKSDVDDEKKKEAEEEEEWADELDGAAYVFVEHADVVEAIADFVAMYMAMVPATQNMSDKELQSMLAGTFGELREKGALRRLWDWGMFLYTSYGWATTAVGVYRDPELALMVMRGLWTVSKWMIMFVV
eukprot:TRINITY_DN66477_c8_g10_i1.p1 TRINITY_DN66477_c8_g10~~TRINITY_DN66477_c8_g10_i1.p1  ORF type:complete len:391 (-),score=156.88 TRINITY_DN66477_c8_g10_i1:76-1173(-)